MFFTVYEYLRYRIHSRLEGSKLKDGYLVDMGIGVLTGGLGGIAVRNSSNSRFIGNNPLLWSFLKWNITTVSMIQCWSAVLPFDVAKTIIQTSPDKATERNPLKVLSSVGLHLDSAFASVKSKYTWELRACETVFLTFIKSSLQIHKRAGLKGCYAGLGPTIVRAFPANAAAIVAWEFSMKMLGIKRD